MQSHAAPAVDPNSSAPQTLTTILEASAATKPGWKTSEFIGKCLVQLIGVGVLIGWIPVRDQAHANELALGLIALVESIYILGRSWLKGAGYVTLAAFAMLGLGGCVGGQLVLPKDIKARVCYITSDGQKVCLKSAGSGVEIEGDITAGRSLGDGKAVFEFGN